MLLTQLIQEYYKNERGNACENKVLLCTNAGNCKRNLTTDVK